MEEIRGHPTLRLPTAQARMLLPPMSPNCPIASRSQSKPPRAPAYRISKLWRRFVAAGIEKASTVANEARVVGRQLAGADALTLDPKASVLETFVGEVVERPPLNGILDRVTPEPDEAPLTLLPVQPNGVVCLPDVRTVANGDEALQVERHLLPADASFERAAPERVGVCDETEAEIQLVLVDGRDD